MVQDDDVVDCWISTYKDMVEAAGGTFPVPQDQFYTYLDTFLAGFDANPYLRGSFKRKLLYADGRIKFMFISAKTTVPAWSPGETRAPVLEQW